MRLKEKVLDEQKSYSLEDFCIWLGPAIYEAEVCTGFELVNDSYYADVGCYSCNGYEPKCRFYSSEKTIVENYLKK